MLVSTLHAFGNAIDETFHDTFHKVFAHILAKKTYAANKTLPKKDRKDLGYYRGPTKGAQRMGEKIKEYIEDEKHALSDKQFPHAACIIDVTRCSVAFENVADLMEGFQRVTSEACQEQFGYKVVRYKNKFHADSTAIFKNIMVNALVNVDGVELVGELQLTTLEYLELKKVNHRFYTITRAFQNGKASPAEAHAAILKQVCN